MNLVSYRPVRTSTDQIQYPTPLAKFYSSSNIDKYWLVLIVPVSTGLCLNFILPVPIKYRTVRTKLFLNFFFFFINEYTATDDAYKNIKFA